MSAEYLPFGYGRQAWCVFYYVFVSAHCSYSYSYISPGHFFAANEVKAVLAHVLVMYNIKFEEGKQAPHSLIINVIHIPRKANVMFRKRQK